MADISKIKLPNNTVLDIKDGRMGNAKIFYGTSSSAADATTKAVTCTDFTSSNLVKGAIIFVTFDYTNEGAVASLKLDVNSTGAKNIKKQRNASAPTTLTGVGEIRANVTYLFVFDGTNWVLMTTDYNSNTTYSAITTSELQAGTATNSRTVTAATLADNYNITNGTINIAGNSITPVTSVKTFAGQSLSGSGDVTKTFNKTINSRGEIQMSFMGQLGVSYPENFSALISIPKSNVLAVLVVGVSGNATLYVYSGEVTEFIATTDPIGYIGMTLVVGTEGITWSGTVHVTFLTGTYTNEISCDEGGVYPSNGTALPIVYLYSKPSTGIPASDIASGVIPSAPGTLVTNNTTAQTASASEALSGTINLHKVAKTGTYSDLIGTPAIPADVWKWGEGQDRCVVVNSSKAGTTAGYDSFSEGYLCDTGGSATSNTKTANASNIAGSCSHAEGNATIAKGLSCHSEGKLTYAGGEGSHAEGIKTNSGGKASHTEGEETKTSNVGEHAGGRYNSSTRTVSNYGNAGNTSFSHGIGTADNARKNALEIMENGDAYLYGVGSYDGTNYSSAETLQTIISNIPNTSNFVQKSGDSMNSDSYLTFDDSSGDHEVYITSESIAVSDWDDSVFINIDPTESGIKVSDSDTNPQNHTTYSFGCIYNVTQGASSVLIALPTSGGTLALTSQIPTVPTISTSVQTDRASDTTTSSPKSVYDEVHPAMASSQPNGGFVPNIFYNLGTVTGTVTFSLASATDNTIVNHYYWTFDTSSTAPTITWPSGVSWMGGSAPTISASKHYEISILNNIGTYMEV